MPLEPGALLNHRYRIERILGQGGFGAVYLAHDEDLAIPCAVKENLNTSPQAERQFRREATLLATLRHPGLPRVTNHFLLGGQQYLVMDFVEGDDLKHRLEQGGALATDDALRWVGQLCEALVYLHSLTPPVIHRDIKPANIKITPGGEAVLVDFGIAKVAESGQRTTTGAAALTSGYAPPEQYQLGATDGRTDEYALAATLYHLLTGQIPPDSVERLIGNATLTPPEALRPDLPGHVTAALKKALEIRPDYRFMGVAQFRDALKDPAFTYTEPVEITQPATLRPEQVGPVQPGTIKVAPEKLTVGRAIAGTLLVVFCLFITLYLAAGLLYFFVGPFELNNRALAYLQTPTAPARQIAQITPRTPAPTSTEFRTRTPVPPSFTPSLTPTHTPSPTPTFTPQPEVISASNAQAWRQFDAWTEGDGSIAFALSPDGQTVALPKGQSIGLFSLDGALVKDLGSFLVNRSVIGVGYLSDSVLVLTERNILRVNIANPASIQTYGFTGSELIVSPDGQWMAIREKYLSIVNINSRQLLRTVGTENTSQRIAFSPNGRYLGLTVGTNAEVWNLTTGQRERTLAGRNKPARGLVFTPDSARLISSGGDVWDVATGQTVAIFDSAADLDTISLSPDGKVLVGSDGTVWDAENWKLISRLPMSAPRRMQFTPDGLRLLWQAQSGEMQVWTVDPFGKAVALATPTPAIAKPSREDISLLNISRLARVERVGSQSYNGAALSPNGETIAAWTGSAVTVFNAITLDPIANLTAQGTVLEADYLGNGFILALTTQRRIERWEIATQTRKQTYEFPTAEQQPRRLVASPTGDLFAAQGKYIQIIDALSGRNLYQLGSADLLQDHAFSPDGKLLAIASKSAVGLWDLSTGLPVARQFGGHGPDTRGLVFTADGARLLSASGDVWEVASRKLIASFETEATSLSVSPDGNLILDNTGALWDANTGQYLGNLSGGADVVAFTPDSDLVLWQDRQGAVSLLGIRPITAHARPSASSATAPGLQSLTPANIPRLSLLGWWGDDALLDVRLLADRAQPQTQARAFSSKAYSDITLSPDKKTITALDRGGMDLIDPATGQVTDHYDLFLNPDLVREVAYLGAELLVLKERAGVERWDLGRQTLEQRYNVLGSGLVVSPDDELFAVRGETGVQVVDVASGQIRNARINASVGPQAYQFSPDGKTLAVARGLFAELWEVSADTVRRGATLRGHTSGVRGLVFSPDGKFLIAASGDIWSLADSKLQAQFDSTAALFAVSPNGALIAGDDGSLWEVATGQRVGTLLDLRAPAERIIFTADGKQLLLHTVEGRTYTWGVIPESPLPKPTSVPNEITVSSASQLAIRAHLGRGRLLNAVWSPDDRYLAVNTTANTIIYEAKELAQVRAYLDAMALAFDHQGNVLIGGAQQPLQLVDVAGGQVVKTYGEITTGIVAAAFSPDDQRLAIGGQVSVEGEGDGIAIIEPDGLVRVLDKGRGRYDEFARMEFSPNGQRLVVSFPGLNTPGSISLWNVETGGKVRNDITGNTMPATVSPDGKFITYFSRTRFIVESLDQGGRLYTIPSDGVGFIDQSTDFPTKFPLNYAYDKNGQLAVFYKDTSRTGDGVVDSSLVLWRFGDNRIIGPTPKFPSTWPQPRIPDVRGPIVPPGLLKLSGLTGLYASDYNLDRNQRTPAFGLSPQEKYFYSLTADGLVRVWNYANGADIATSLADDMPLMALSPDGKTVAVPDALGNINLMDVASGSIVRTFNGEWYPTALAYGSDSVLMAWQEDGTLTLLNVSNGGAIETYSDALYGDARNLVLSPTGRLFAMWARVGVRSQLNVFSLAPNRSLFALNTSARPEPVQFSPDEQTLAVVKGSTVELWSLQTRQIIRTLTGQGRTVGELAFSPDGTRLYAATGEIWNVADGALATQFDSKSAHLLISPNGLVVVGSEGAIWNAADGLPVGALNGVRAPAIRFTFTPDSTRLLWQTGDGTIEVWAVGK
jgi:WD40 repeat protein/serine/threonine protein kinase